MIVSDPEEIAIKKEPYMWRRHSEDNCPCRASMSKGKGLTRQAQTRQDEREKLAKAFSDSEPDYEIIHHKVIIHLKLQVYKKGRLLVDVVNN